MHRDGLWIVRATALALSAWSSTPGSIRAQTDDGSYRVLKRVVADKGGVGLLALDSDGRRLYGAGNTVINVDDDSIVARLPGNVGHGYAFARDLDRGITRRGALFELRSAAVLDSGAGASQASVVYDRQTQRAFVFGDSATVIDVRTGKRMPLSSLRGEALAAVTDGRGHIFVRMASDSILRLDSKSLATDSRWGVIGCSQALGFAMDAKHSRLFLSCGNSQLLILSALDGHPIETLATGGPALQLAFDGRTHLIFNPTGRGTISVVREDTPDHFTRLPDISSEEASARIAIDERTHRLFLCTVASKTDPVKVLVLTQ